MNATSALSLLLILPLASAPLIYIIGRVSYLLKSKHNLAPWAALLVLVFTLIPLTVCLRSIGQAIELSAYGMTFVMDGIGLLVTAVVLVLGILVTIYSFVYMKGEEGEEKFFALLVAMIGAIIGLCSANDLFNMWVWFETMAVSSYMLVAFYRHQSGSLEAGMKYIVQSAVGSTLILLGIALVYGHTGTLDFPGIKEAASSTALLAAAGVLFVIGFGVKSALVPMHTWLPDAHSQAPSGISAMLSGIVIEAGLIAMLRALAPISGLNSNWGAVLIGLGAVNILVGNLMALRQEEVKRLLAYSSISHMGYIVTGIGIAVSFGIANGASGAFFHLTVHAMMKGLAFLCAGALMYALFISQNSHKVLTRDDLRGAALRYPVVAFVFSLAILSLGGLPPLAGFMSKWQIILSAFEAKNGLLLGLAIFMALNSVLSLGYYAPLINRMYRKEASDAVLSGNKLSIWIVLPLICLAAGIIVLGFYPTLLNGLFEAASASLLAIFG
jgi:proton-translocating NADH-quinone oxidoreductase chain N